MRVFNDFTCNSCGTLYVDQYEEASVATIKCSNCKSVATKVRHVPKFTLPGNGQGFPSADDKWVRMRDQKMAEERKSESS